MSPKLTAEIEDLVENKVKSGNYSSAADVIREALGLLEERDQMLLLQKQEIASERETAYLFESETMKQRLLAAAQRRDGLNLDDVLEKLGL
jgi:putative addiction module CopG family antidote